MHKEGRFDELIARAESFDREGKLTQKQANAVAWFCFMGNSHHDAAPLTCVNGIGRLLTQNPLSPIRTRGHRHAGSTNGNVKQ